MTRIFVNPNLGPAKPIADQMGIELTSDLHPNLEVIVTDHEEIDADFLNKFTRLIGVVRGGVGFDLIDQAEAARRGIVCAHVPDYCTEEVADTAIAMIIGITRGVFAFKEKIRSDPSKWKASRYGLEHVRRTTSQTLGIIGLGRIGRSVAWKSRSLGFRVVAFDPYQPAGCGRSLGVEQVRNLEELLRESDVVSLHIPLTDDTEGLVDAEFLRMMKPGASLVNTSRGRLFADEKRLLAALRSRKLAALATDVLRQEPPVQSPLYKAWQSGDPDIAGRLIITPHTAFYSRESVSDLLSAALRQANQILRGETPDHPIPGS